MFKRHKSDIHQQQGVKKHVLKIRKTLRFQGVSKQHLLSSLKLLMGYLTYPLTTMNFMRVRMTIKII